MVVGVGVTKRANYGLHCLSEKNSDAPVSVFADLSTPTCRKRRLREIADLEAEELITKSEAKRKRGEVLAHI